MAIESFDFILLNALEAFGRKSTARIIRDIYPEFNETQSEYLARSVRRYKRCETVPEYETASELLFRLGIRLSSSDLILSLQKAKEKKNIQRVKYRHFKLERGIRLDYALFSLNGVSMSEMDIILQDRIKETTKNGSMNEYIALLIKRDLEYLLLPSIDKQEEKE